MGSTDFSRPAPSADRACRSYDAPSRRQFRGTSYRRSRQRERQTRLTTIEERQRTHEYHVFLCHNSSDKPVVRSIKERLRDQGVLAWFDERTIVSGDRFAPKIEQALDTVKVVAVFIGPYGLGRWQDMEYHAALQRSVEKRDSRGRATVRLIPVLLPGAAREPDLPVFLRGLHSVDLRDGGPDNREGMRSLVAAILSDPDAPFGDGR